MAKGLRKPLQGIFNIIRFNWHYYVLALLSIVLVAVAGAFLPEGIQWMVKLIIVLILIGTYLSLLISFFIYDLSGLYKMHWLSHLNISEGSVLANIHAGFDETSALLAAKFPQTQLHVFDFYNPEVHTEISIKRARKAYPPYPDTKSVSTNHIPLHDASCSMVLLIFAAHEIRNEGERETFLKEVHRVLKPNGIAIVVEHLRDAPNFFAYNIGFMHFHSRRTWMKNLASADFKVLFEQKHTPFISIFTLSKNGTTS